jgi:hypothetical protein
MAISRTVADVLGDGVMTEDELFDLFHLVGASCAAHVLGWLIWNYPSPEAIVVGLLCIPLELGVVGSVLANQNLIWWKNQLRIEVCSLFGERVKE